MGDVENAGAVGDQVNGDSQDLSPIEMADEIRKLRKELAKSQRREEILKKAALILGNDPRNNMSWASPEILTKKCPKKLYVI